MTQPLDTQSLDTGSLDTRSLAVHSLAAQPLAAQDASRRGAAFVRTGRIGLRILAAIALIGGSVAFAGLTDNTAAVAADSACDGVTVVVDFTDIGGELNVVCAQGEQESGRTALLAAGFTAADSQQGFLCAINSMPDPCPETFDGNFWSYWNASPAGQWTSYEVGADSSTPAAGAIEGWRYNDGTTPPGLAPSEVAAALSPSTPDATDTPEATPGNDEAVTTSTLADQQSDQTVVLAATAVGFLALIIALLVFFMVRKRRDASGSRD